MKRLMASSKFWVAVMDAFAATLAIVLTWFLAPDKVEQALALVAIWQPVFLAVIIGTWKEDMAAKEAAGWANQSAVLKADVKALTTISEDTPK
jgi:hypothetical protein